MTNIVDIKVDGEVIEFEIEELSEIEKIRVAATAPASAKGGNPEFNEDVLDWILDLVKRQTVLTDELIEEIPQEELSRLFNGVVLYSLGEDADLSRRYDDGTELDSSVFEDLDDWQ